MVTRGEIFAVVFLLGTVVGANLGSAGERPSKGRGTGVVTSVCNGNVCTNHEEGTYIATHVGRSTYVSDSTTVFSTPFCGSVSGSTVLTAANGDQSFNDFEDDICFDGSLGVYSGTYTVTGGTGRFSDATGSGTISGTLDCSVLPCIDSISNEGTGDY